jgi:hypothetical protein
MQPAALLDRAGHKPQKQSRNCLGGMQWNPTMRYTRRQDIGVIPYWNECMQVYITEMQEYTYFCGTFLSRTWYPGEPRPPYTRLI